jgi:hypothetical protein
MMSIPPALDAKQRAKAFELLPKGGFFNEAEAAAMKR